jgi:hypothetical protein
MDNFNYREFVYGQSLTNSKEKVIYFHLNLIDHILKTSLEI